MVMGWLVMGWLEGSPWMYLTWVHSGEGRCRPPYPSPPRLLSCSFAPVTFPHQALIFSPCADVCNMISLRSETFGVFGQTAPQPYPQPRPGKRTIWPMQCYDNVPREIESGQMLINKERVWKALYMVRWRATSTVLSRHLAYASKIAA